MSKTQQKTFTWEGRCYENKYDNMELINIYISMQVSSDFCDLTVNNIKTWLGKKLVLYEEKKYDEENEEDEHIEEIYYCATIVVLEEQKDEILSYLTTQGFQQR